MKLMDKAKQAALAAAVKTGLGYLEKDPEVNIPKLMELVDKFVPDGWYESQRNAIRNAIQNKDSNWYNGKKITWAGTNGWIATRESTAEASAKFIEYLIRRLKRAYTGGISEITE